MKDVEIKNQLSPDSILIKWIFERLQGITIALEPEYTIGISKSMKFLSLIEKLWFRNFTGNWQLLWSMETSERSIISRY